jgi:hypothetical protein
MKLLFTVPFHPSVLSRFFIGLLLISVSSYTFAMRCMDETQVISIKYLGVGALDIRYQQQRVLTDPFYSVQPLWDILTFKKYHSNRNTISKALGPYEKNVNNVLVGHGHYDHLADLPAIKNYLTSDTKIIGSTTMANMVAPVYGPKNILVIDKGNENEWHYIANGWIRIKAKLSEHAPQFMNYNFAPDSVDRPRSKLPRYIWSWQQGNNLSYMIDFLREENSENVYKRMFLQTSASNFPIGYQVITDSTPVDVIFIAAASFNNVDDYPSGLLRSYKPEKTYFIHWENFFKPWLEKAEPLATIDFEKLLAKSKIAHNKKYILPNPMDCLYF